MRRNWLCNGRVVRSNDRESPQVMTSSSCTPEPDSRGLSRASLIDREKPRLVADSSCRTSAFGVAPDPGRQQHGTVITQHYTEPDLRLVVRPSRLRPVMDAPRPWPATRLRIAFFLLPHRYRYRRCPSLSYGPPRSRPEHRESIYEIRSSGRIQQNP